MLFHKILITGCGGDIGLGIGRILQEEKIADAVVGCDMEEDHAGKVFLTDALSRSVRRRNGIWMRFCSWLCGNRLTL